MTKPHLTLVEQFFGHVDKDGPVPDDQPELGPCWLWTAATNSSGYGCLRVRGVLLLAHRVMWKLAHGRAAPVDREVLHRCDTPACVRPSHLWIGTHAQNMADAKRKGRARNQHTKVAA